MRSPRLLDIAGVPPLLAVLATLLLWQAGARLLDADFLPTIPSTAAALHMLAEDPSTLSMLGVSLRNMFVGFALAFVVAVPLGLAMGRNRVLHALVDPLLTLGYPMPKAALMPIITLWFGLGFISKVVVIFLGASLPLLYHSYVGAANVDEKLLWQARAFGMGAGRRLFKVVLPMSLPDVFLGCRVGLSMALVVMVSSEMIVRQAGVGDLLFNALDLAQYDTVYAVIAIIAVIGAVLDVLLEAVRRRVVFWSNDAALQARS